ncbi:MAG: FtsX-like permease family protein [Bacteroides sp.]|nr:FtsX-like permease family protein [Eubacterium sp.]MCM1418966.1 FtsX-like permease family protein [Roseburia sp.]MCM1463098.1 FtsX-like permease family protein [Bacteroides sp.]
MKNALKKSAYREIRGTKSRFFSIFGIVAIGVGFFSGLKASAPDMRLSADTYFDRTNLTDFRLVSTYGFDEGDLSALETISDASVVPSYFTDVIAEVDGGSPNAARVFTLGANDAGYNTLTLIDGRLPERAGECVAVGSGMKNTVVLGSTVVFTDGDGESPDDILADSVFTIVGTVVSPVFIDKTGFGSTSVGNGSIGAVYYVPEESFCVEYNTEVYLRFPELTPLLAYGEVYKARVETLTETIEAVARRRETERYNEIVDEANETLADARKELADAEKEADDEIADGEAELLDAKKKLDDAEKEIADGEQEILNGEEKLKDARAELDQGYLDLEKARADYAEEIERAEKELNEAGDEISQNEKKLNDGEKELEDGKRDYTDGLARYEDGLAQYEDGRAQYEEGYAAYEAGLTRYNEQKATFDEGKAQYEAGEAEYAEGAARLAEAKAALDEAEGQLGQLRAMLGENSPQYQAAKAEYDQNHAAYEASVAELTAARAALDETKAQIDAGEAQLAEAKATLDETKARLDEAKVTLDETKTQLDEAKAALDEAKVELDDAEKELADGRAQLEDGKKQYADGLAELEQAKIDAEKEFADAEQALADGEREIVDGEKELADAREKLADGKADFEQGKKDYADGEKELADGKAEAEEKIADAKAELADAKQEIADLEKPEWYVFTREDNFGYAEYGDNADRINNIAAVFPVFFILVAMLVCLTTMTRMVEEERIQIGTLKALGYSNGKIIYKYMLYAVTATVSGAVFGVLVGMKLIPFVIVTAYGMMYSIPELQMPIDLGTAAASILVSLAAIAATVFFACRSALAEQAAQLMRFKAPKAGKRIFIERLGFLWKRFNFSGKVTARNLFRYKRKMFMSVIGIAGCTALLMTGFALYDAINDIIIKQYGELQSYDGIAVYDAEKYPGADERAAAIIAEHGGSVNVFQKQMDVSAGGKKVGAYIAVPRQSERFTDFLNLRDRASGEPYRLTDGTVYMDEKLTLLIGVKAGDRVTIEESDTERVEVTLTAPFENYPGHYVYMTERTYIDLFGEAPEYNALYFAHGLSEEDEDALAERLLDGDGVLAVTFSSNVKQTYQDMLKTLSLVIVVVIVSAGALAFIVMYNLTNINISERVREIATLKVLGFYDGEVDTYIFRENLILTLLGTAVGLVLGVFLATYVITTAEVDFVMFGRVIYPMSYILAAAFTLVFSVVVMLVMHKKLKDVNMIDALKSIE